MKNVRKLKVVWLAVLGLLLLAGPVGAAKIDGPEGYFFKATTNLLQYGDAGVQLQMAPNVMRSNAKVKIEKLDPSTLQGSGGDYVSKAVGITLLGDNSSMQGSFTQPMRLIISFDMTDFRRASNLDTSQPVQKFRLGYYDESSKNWTELASTVFWNGTSGQVEASPTQGTGRYALLWSNSSPPSTLGGSQIRLFLNYNPIMSQTAPYVKEGRTMVPLTVIAENLGAKVNWVAATKTIEIKDNINHITLTVGSTTADKNGTALAVEVAPEVVNGHTFVPLGFVVNALGAEANWDGMSRSIYIMQQQS